MAALLATVEELEAMLNTRVGGAGAERELLELLLAGASEAAERHTGRLLHPEPEPAPEGEPEPEPVLERLHGYGRELVRIPDARELTAVRADGRTVAVSAYHGDAGYRLLARRGHPAHAIVVPGGAYVLELEGRFGFDPTPPDVRVAVLSWAARAYHERNARGADSVADPEGGGWSYYRQLPAGIAATLDRYRIPGL